MATNGIDLAAETQTQPLPRILAFENRVPEPAPAEDFALAPLVDKIAYGIARGLIVAVKELENHIASETRKVGDSVDRRMDAVQAALQDLSAFMVEQRSTNAALQEQVQQLAAADASLRETEAKQAAELEALRTETKAFSTEVTQRIDTAVAGLTEADTRQAAELASLQNQASAFSQTVTERIDGLCKELGVQQEDIGALKSTLSAFSSRVDSLVERLDRQGEAVRSLCTAYSQRENELEQLVDGLARLRAYPTPLPAL